MSLPTKACSRESSPGTNSVGFSWEVGGFRTNSSLSQQRRGPHLLQSWWYHSWWRKGSKEAFVFLVLLVNFYFGNPQQTPFWTTISQKGRCFAVKGLVVLFPDPQVHGSSGCRTNVWLWMLSLTRWVFHNLPLQCRAVCLISCARQGLRSLPCSCKVSHKLEETTANLRIPGGIDRSNILFIMMIFKIWMYNIYITFICMPGGPMQCVPDLFSYQDFHLSRWVMPCSPRTGRSTFDCFKCSGTQLVSLLVNIKRCIKKTSHSPLKWGEEDKSWFHGFEIFEVWSKMSCGQASCSIARSFLVARRKENEVWRREWGVKGCAFMTAMDAVDVLIAVIIDLPVFLPLDWSIRGLVTFFHWLSHGLVEQARQSKTGCEPLILWQTMKVSKNSSWFHLRLHCPLISWPFIHNSCPGAFKNVWGSSWGDSFGWFSPEVGTQNSEGQSMVKSTILQCYFPSPVVALNADLVVAMLRKSVQASTVLRKRCVRLRFVIRNGIWDLAKTWRHLNFEPDMIQWRKTYVQDESRDAYSNFRLCCNSDPWLDLG